MRAYRTGDPHDAGRANPYRELLAQGPPSTRPHDDVAPPAAGMPPLPDDAASTAGSPPPAGSLPSADAAPSAPGSAGGPVTRQARPSGTPNDVKVVLPGKLSPRRPGRSAQTPAPAGPSAPAAPAGHATAAATAALVPAAAEPSPEATSAPSMAPAHASAASNPQTRRSRRPTPRRRFRRYYRSAAWLILGLGIGGFFVAGVAIDRLGAWDHEVPLQEDTALSFPRSAERWIWLPEEHVDDIVCTGTDGSGANLPMRPALGYDHDDYSSAYRFPTGDGSVTLRCDVAPSPATAGWTPTGTETVRVAEPVDRSRDVPFLQAAFIVMLGGPALGVVMFVGTLLAQIVTGVAGLVAKMRRRHAGRRQTPTQAGPHGSARRRTGSSVRRRPDACHPG